MWSFLAATEKNRIDGHAVWQGDIIIERFAQVEDEAIGRRLRDDRREDGHRAVCQDCRSERNLRTIEIDIVARSELCQSVFGCAETQGWRGPNGQFLDRDA